MARRCLVFGLVAGERSGYIQGAATEDEGNEKREAPKVSVGGTTRYKRPRTHLLVLARPAIDKDVPFKVLPLCVMPAFVVA